MAKVRSARVTTKKTWGSIIAARLLIALGTDSLHGCLAFDAAKLVEFGAMPIQALRAATVGGAEVCGLSDRGRLAPGLRADLLAVRGNAVDRIECLADPILVSAGGRSVSRASPARL